MSPNALPSLQMLCKLFIADTFHCCLFVGLSAFSFIFSDWKACCFFLLKSGHSLGHWILLHIFALRNSYFAWCFASLTIWIFRLCSINFYSIKLNWYREYHLEHFRIIFLLLLSAGHITQFHWQPYMPICNLPPSCLKDVMVWFSASS